MNTDFWLGLIVGWFGNAIVWGALALWIWRRRTPLLATENRSTNNVVL